jgi:hypothetical protein
VKRWAIRGKKVARVCLCVTRARIPRHPNAVAIAHIGHHPGWSRRCRPTSCSVRPRYSAGLRSSAGSRAVDAALPGRAGAGRRPHRAVRDVEVRGVAAGRRGHRAPWPCFWPRTYLRWSASLVLAALRALHVDQLLADSGAARAEEWRGVLGTGGRGTSGWQSC